MSAEGLSGEFRAGAAGFAGESRNPSAPKSEPAPRKVGELQIHGETYNFKLYNRREGEAREELKFTLEEWERLAPKYEAALEKVFSTSQMPGTFEFDTSKVTVDGKEDQAISHLFLREMSQLTPFLFKIKTDPNCLPLPSSPTTAPTPTSGKSQPPKKPEEGPESPKKPPSDPGKLSIEAPKPGDRGAAAKETSLESGRPLSSPAKAVAESIPQGRAYSSVRWAQVLNESGTLTPCNQFSLGSGNSCTLHDFYYILQHFLHSAQEIDLGKVLQASGAPRLRVNNEHYYYSAEEAFDVFKDKFVTSDGTFVESGGIKIDDRVKLLSAAELSDANVLGDIQSMLQTMGAQRVPFGAILTKGGYSYAITYSPAIGGQAEKWHFFNSHGEHFETSSLSGKKEIELDSTQNTPAYELTFANLASLMNYLNSPHYNVSAPESRVSLSVFTDKQHPLPSRVDPSAGPSAS